jgi:hypothetical protein
MFLDIRLEGFLALAQLPIQRFGTISFMSVDVEDINIRGSQSRRIREGRFRWLFKEFKFGPTDSTTTTCRPLSTNTS